MNLTKHLRKALLQASLSKAEKAKLGEGVHDIYKERAAKGGDILWYATIKEQKELAPGIPLHMSLKVFEDKKDMDLDEIKEKIKKLDIQTPDPKKLKFKTTIFTSERDGKKYYMLLVDGTDKAYSDFYEDFKHTGTVYKKFMPHITIDKGLYDKINKEGIKPEEVSFSNLSIEAGAENTIHSFEKSENLNKSNLNLDKGHKDISEKSLADIQKETAWTWASRAAACYEKLAKTGDWKWKNDAEEYRHEAVEHAALIGDTHPYVLEEIHKSLEKYRNNSIEIAKDIDKLEKSGLKNIITAGVMAGALASPNIGQAEAPSHGPLHPNVSGSANSSYSREKLLNAIATVESSNGKNLKHKPTSQGTAWGKYAIMPAVIQDTIRLNPDLKRKHAKALRLQGDNLNRYMEDNPNLEQEIANKHIQRLEHHFGHNPEAIAYGWNQGITGTNRDIKAKKNIGEHPYVQKFKQAYESEK